jgi:hypothetical protein
VYRGCVRRWVSDDAGIQLVYNFHLLDDAIDGGATEESDIEGIEQEKQKEIKGKDGQRNLQFIVYKAPEWAEGASNQALVPAELQSGVDPFWDLKVADNEDGLHLDSKAYKVFMEQIEYPCKHCVELL